MLPDVGGCVDCVVVLQQAFGGVRTDAPRLWYLFLLFSCVEACVGRFVGAVVGGVELVMCAIFVVGGLLGRVTGNTKIGVFWHCRLLEVGCRSLLVGFVG